MKCISNSKIAFLTKVEYKESFRNKKSKENIKGTLPLSRKKHKAKKIKTLKVMKMLL